MAPKGRNPLTSTFYPLPLPNQSSSVTTLVQIEHPVSTGKTPYEYTISLSLDEVLPLTSSTVIEALRNNVSYDMTTEQCRQAETVTLGIISDDNNGSLNGPGLEPGYDMTARQDDKLDAFDKLMLEENEQSFWVYEYTDTLHSCPYKDLLACNGMISGPWILNQS